MKQTISELEYERVYALLQRPSYTEAEFNLLMKQVGMAPNSLLI